MKLKNCSFLLKENLIVILLPLFLLLTCSNLFAHLMVPQRGILNFKDGFGYLALSIPVSSLSGVDDDMDGTLSIKELSDHQDSIISQINNRIDLTYKTVTLLKEVAYIELNSLDPEHYLNADQLIVLTRFTLPVISEMGSVRLALKSLKLAINLFGVKDNENSFHLTIIDLSYKTEININSDRISSYLQQ